MKKKCCEKCKDGKKCRKEQAWVRVYESGAGANKVPFTGLGKSRAKPKGCKSVEMHARTTKGKMNFAGPGTCFAQRRARGDKGITHTDWCGKLHDMWYDKKNATRTQIKRADDDFRRCVKAAPGESINKRIMGAVFAGKRMLEKTAGLNPLRGTSSEVEKKSQSKVKEDMRRRNGKGKAKKAAGKMLKEVFRTAIPRKDRRYPNEKWEGRK